MPQREMRSKPKMCRGHRNSCSDAVLCHHRQRRGCRHVSLDVHPSPVIVFQSTGCKPPEIYRTSQIMHQLISCSRSQWRVADTAIVQHGLPNATVLNRAEIRVRCADVIYISVKCSNRTLNMHQNYFCPEPGLLLGELLGITFPKSLTFSGNTLSAIPFPVINVFHYLFPCHSMICLHTNLLPGIFLVVLLVVVDHDVMIMSE